MKQPGSKLEKYKARIIFQGHKDREKEFMIPILETVRNKNINILISISVSYKKEDIK